MKYLILGAKGQLGSEFLRTLSERNSHDEVTGMGRENCDISNLSELLNVFEDVKPDVVINCAAYNSVDRAEEDYITAIKVNAIGVRNIAFACNRYKSFLVHYGTDYVFDGKKENGLYTEDDEPNPINEYGKSKLMGEDFLKDELGRFLIFRVSWVYGNGTQNFIYKLLRWAECNDYLKVSSDEVSVPTSTRTIVDVTLKALKDGLEGLYHLTNSGYASRYEWAKEVFKVLGIDKFIRPVSSEMFNLPAKRPKFSAMSNEKLKQELNIDIKTWEEGLEEVLNDKEN